MHGECFQDLNNPKPIVANIQRLVSRATGNSDVSPASVAAPSPGSSSCGWKYPESGRRKSSEVSTRLRFQMIQTIAKEK